MKYLFTLFLIAALLSCKKDVDPNKKDDIQQERSGLVKLPQGSSLAVEELELTTLTSESKVNVKGEFNLSATKGQNLTMAFATEKKSDKVILLGIIQDKSQEVEIGTVSTAISLVMLNPYTPNNDSDVSQLISLIQKDVDFTKLEMEVGRTIVEGKDIFLDLSTTAIGLINNIQGRIWSMDPSSGRTYETQANSKIFGNISLSMQDPNKIVLYNFGSWMYHIASFYDKSNFKFKQVIIPRHKISGNLYAGIGRAFDYVNKNPAAIKNCLSFISTSGSTSLCPSGLAALYTLDIGEPINVDIGDRKWVKVRVTNGLYGLTSTMGTTSPLFAETTSEDFLAFSKNAQTLYFEILGIFGVEYEDVGVMSALLSSSGCTLTEPLGLIEEDFAKLGYSFFKKERSNDPYKGSEGTFEIFGKGTEIIVSRFYQYLSKCPGLNLFVKQMKYIDRATKLMKKLTVFTRAPYLINSSMILRSMATEPTGFDIIIDREENQLNFAKPKTGLTGVWTGIHPQTGGLIWLNLASIPDYKTMHGKIPIFSAGGFSAGMKTVISSWKTEKWDWNTLGMEM